MTSVTSLPRHQAEQQQQQPLRQHYSVDHQYQQQQQQQPQQPVDHQQQQQPQSAPTPTRKTCSSSNSSSSSSKPATTANTTTTLNNNGTNAVIQSVFGAVFTGVILLTTLFYRLTVPWQTTYGPCRYDVTQLTARCSAITSSSQLPDVIPENAQILIFDASDDDNDVIVDFGTLEKSNLTRLRRLRQLSLISCGLDGIGPNAFSELTELRRLDLSYNRIAIIGNESFHGLIKLDFLSLSGNPLIELSDGCFSGLTVSRLEFINNTQLVRIGHSAFLNSRVTSLVMDRCSLDVVDRSSWKHLAPSLHELAITNNLRSLNIDYDALQGFRLHRLTLTNDSLTDAGFLTSALGGDHNEIDLNENRNLWSSRRRVPADAAAAGCCVKTTRRLSLTATGISKLSDVLNVSIFSELEELNLSQNAISELDSQEFVALHRLTLLDLSDNVIDRFQGNFTVDADIGGGGGSLKQLEQLRLDRNQLQTIPEVLARPLFDRIQSGVHLTGNPLHFNCELNWIVATLARLPDGVINGDKVASGDVTRAPFKCRPPVILNATVDQNRSELVCLVDGDPAPRVTWSNDAGVDLFAVEQSKTIRNVTTKRAVLRILRPGNFTCTGENVLGRVQAAVPVSRDQVLQHPDNKYDSSSTEYEELQLQTISIITTPLGFTLTISLIILLSYLLKTQ